MACFCALAGGLGVAVASADPAPIAAYSFDAGEGTTLEDLTGNEHTGTIEGASWFDHGKYGKALSFDGENDCVTIADSADLQLTEDFTLEAWVKPQGDGDSEPILFKEGPGAYGLYDGLYNEGNMEGLIGEASFTRALDYTDAEPNVWTHLALTYDGAQMRLYVDGELADTTPAPEGVEPSTGDLSIGCDTEYKDHFEGLIDEVRVYDRALGAGEVGGDSAAPIQTPQQAPIAAYSFDAGEGTTLEDLTGNEHTGTIEGASWFDHGKYGKALSFDGENDCVKIADSADLQLTEDFTLEAWVKPQGDGDSEPILFKEGPGAYGLYDGLYNEGNMEGLIGEASFTRALDYTDAEPNVWTHLALTYDGAQMRLYVDGELADTTPAPEGVEPSSGDLSIGCDTEYKDHFEGLIDEVRVYDRALDAGEVGGDKATPIEEPQAAPVAAYSFDAGEGSTLEDITGSGHEGTIEGASWFDHGKYGKALSFDGENDCVKIADAEDLALTEDFTLEAWVKPQGDGDSEPILFKEGPGAYGLYDGLYNEGNMEGLIGEASFTRALDYTDAEPNVWTHLALTYDGAQMRLYVDGELADTTPAPEGVEPSTGDLSIGCDTEYKDHFEGLIDEVRVYDRALGAGEVGGDSAAPIQTPQQAPIAAYSFDAGEGTTLEDLTGNEHTGTIEGASWFDHGKYGKALSFDGENDCVKIADSADLQLTEDFTLEAWVKPQGDGDSEPILFKEGPGAYGLYDGLYNEGNMEGLIGEASFTRALDYTDAEPNVWTHLALTYDGAQMRLYVDGELTDTTPAPEGVEASSGDLSIGCDTEYKDHFKGLIDEVRVYDRALDAGEAADALAPRFHEPFHVYAYQIAGAETTEIFFDEAEDPPLPEGQPGSGVDLYKYRTSINESAYTGWEESSVPYFALAGVHEGDVISVQITLRDHVWNESGVYESTVIAPPAGPPAPGEYSPEEGAPGAPGGTCAAEPERAGCPQVEKVIVVPTSEETSTPYGSVMSARGVPPGDKCAVMATYPRVARFNSAHTEAQNECLPGYGVIYTELFVSLYKFQEDGELQFRGSDKSGRRSGAGLTTKNHYSDCHGRTDFNWKGEAWAYTDIEGIGYFGSNQKIRSIPCN